ncbi:MAG: asparagine synthetase B, partial [Alteromonadales bacterium]|nr:asparagine synthetase B [Alteromonadales bacterium]
MCGIAGFTQFHQQQGSIDSLKAMGERIFHRGPDAGSEYLTDNVGLCHRRLAIIDLSEAGVQPMKSVDEQVIISFNGEIYNYLELREDLIKQGVEFKTDTDTEVIIALYQSIGIKLL